MCLIGQYHKALEAVDYLILILNAVSNPCTPIFIADLLRMRLLKLSGMRHVVVTRHRGTSVVRSLKLDHPPHFSTITRIKPTTTKPHTVITVT